TPLKIAVLPFIEEPDRSVIDTGACNTIVGRRGYNTDGEAALDEIRARIDPRGRRAIVVGAGGAARAVAVSLRGAGAQVTIATREDPVVPPAALRAAFVLDLRYAPRGEARETALVSAARRAGVPAEDGLGMLVRQAAVQIRLFTGQAVPLDVLMNCATS